MSAVITKMAGDIFAAVNEFVDKAVTPLRAKVAELELRLLEVPAVKDGAPGKDAVVDYDAISMQLQAMLAKEMESIPTPKDGADGKDGEAGKDGMPGVAGEHGDKGVDGLPGKDGVDGKDGEPGREGEPGRDALQIDVLDAIDTDRKYQRGTFACYRGGIVRSFRVTDPIGEDGNLEKSGWSIIVHGIHEIAIEQGDDLRSFGIGVQTTGGQAVTKTFAMPAMIYRGVFKEGEDYEQGDVTTWGGSTWHCNAPTKERPGAGGTVWTLTTKCGRDGKDGKDGERGEKGLPGAGGRDLTHMGPDGRKYT